MSSWQLFLPQGELEIKTSRQGSSTAVLLAGGRKPAAEWLVQTAAAKDIYCADKGIECCCENNLKPLWLCGDADSAAKDCWQQAQAAGVKILLHEPLKDDTDLQLLLAALPEAVNIVASGIWGGRFDHLYSNVFSLLHYKNQRGVQVVLADEQEIMVLLQQGESLLFKPARPENIEALSLLPLADRNEVTLQGVQWNLEHSPLFLTHPYAVSNMIEQEKVIFTCDQGRVGFYLKYKI